ncbi:MAG: uroporphyrinogen-III C-methyltransferase [Planctomycetales bacterium]|nr:uroporphyrinogen-III C-methyltransferase [Planctomycetales bacterium]
MQSKTAANVLGRVYLVGAGPGDPLLITLRAVECLRQADLVLYDYLVNAEILEHAAGAQCECLGRHGQGRLISQADINKRLVDEARLGKVVVRLKGGDPVIFARAAEETAALSAAGIPWEIVPGVTAALAAGSYAGIHITDRNEASGVALVTGHESPDKGGAPLDYAALARFPGTLIFYMGVTTAPHWSAALLAAGKPAETPVTIVRRCSWSDQQVLECSLGALAEVLAPGKMRPPAIILVGEVAHPPRERSWLGTRPLFGQTVLVTRPEAQNDRLRLQLQLLGAEVLVQPAIAISAPRNFAEIDAAIANLSGFDWIVFSSANGVRYFFSRLANLDQDARALARTKIAAIGPATAEELSATHGLRADLVPETYRAEALAEALSQEANGRRFLLVRASRGREVLSEQLLAAGGDVTQVVAYQSVDVQLPASEIAERLRAGEIHWTTATSSAIARSLVAMFGDRLHQTRLVSISPLTSSVLRESGFEPQAEAVLYTADGLIQAILEADKQS